jgi:hypothetical protein
MTNGIGRGGADQAQIDRHRPAGPGGHDLYGRVAAVTAWLDAVNPGSGHGDALHVMKIGEEFGEVVAAYLGVTGDNPRKGRTHSRADLLAELADVVVAALCAIEHFTGDRTETERVVTATLATVTARIPRGGPVR